MIIETEKYISSGAIFDPTNTYRYTLWRAWSPDHPQVTFVMLNPSTADAQRNDPTISRCLAFAQHWGFGTLEVVNLFAYKTAYPSDLLKVTHPIGAENDHFLLQAIARSSCIVVAWGTKGAFLDRDKQVLQFLAQCQRIYCLGITRDGHPRHPLYTRRDIELIPFSIPVTGSSCALSSFQ